MVYMKYICREAELKDNRDSKLYEDLQIVQDFTWQ